MKSTIFPRFHATDLTILENAKNVDLTCAAIPERKLL